MSFFFLPFFHILYHILFDIQSKFYYEKGPIFIHNLTFLTKLTSPCLDFCQKTTCFTQICFYGHHSDIFGHIFVYHGPGDSWNWYWNNGRPAMARWWIYWRVVVVFFVFFFTWNIFQNLSKYTMCKNYFPILYIGFWGRRWKDL